MLLLLHLYALLLHLQHLHAYICTLQAHFRFRKFRICLQVLRSDYSLQSSFDLYHMLIQAYLFLTVLQGREVHHLLYHLHRLPLHHLHPVSYKDILSLQELPALYSFPLPMQELPLPIHSLEAVPLFLPVLCTVIQVFLFRPTTH